MSRRRVRSWLCACALVACASPAPEAPTPAPPAAADAALSPERQRFERWKQGAEAADPRQAFAREAEAEAARRRSAALAQGVDPEGGVEAEMLEDRLAELGTGNAGCFQQEPDLSVQDDWIRHRQLTREDFLAPEDVGGARPAVRTSGEVGAYVVVRFACVAKGALSEPEPGHFTVEVERVRYLALLSRRRSWWSPEAGDDPWVLRHEQLHFDVAELIAQELTAHTAELDAPPRGAGPDPHAAIEDFRRRWAEHMREQQERFTEIEQQYDRETRNGSDRERQTEWFARVKRGLGAVRAGLETKPVLVP